MTELTIALRCRNVATTIASTIESALQQQQVAFQLIVVDDSSTDNSAKIIRSFTDPRMIFLETDRERGAGHCYNLALARNRTAYFATLHVDCLLQPNASRKLLDACSEFPDTGLAHGYYFETDANGGGPSRDKFRSQRELFEKFSTPATNYQRLLLVKGNIAHHFRIYRTSALMAVGRFDERTSVDEDYDMALRIAECYRIKVIREYLYCWHRPARSKAKSHSRRLLEWTHRVVHYHRLAKAKQISFPASKSGFRTLLFSGLYDRLGLAYSVSFVLHRLESWYWRCRLPAETRLYRLVVAALSNQRLSPAVSTSTLGLTKGSRIAYYTWHFPVLSQTFINRELAALKNSGIAFEIIADEPEEPELADDNAMEVLEQAHYLEPINPCHLRTYHQRLFRNRPLEYLRSFCFVLSRRYGSYKTIYEDIAVFSRAVHLAGILRDKQIDHIHSPWSDRCAFVAMLAARLAGATYSVQARAHDIHRKSYLFAFAEKFEPARFVVTNTRYNESYMKTFLAEADWPKLTVIHNGLDLKRFAPRQKDADRSSMTRVLCVARLIEQKGLSYLLQACARLREGGHSFECEIVGGTEDIYMNYYLELKKLHRNLALENQVRFVGSLPFKAVLKKYSQADIFILPCVIAEDGSRDITPNALIEAMAMKLAVISTTVTGVPEIVEDGVSGILVPPHDDIALAAALAKVIQDYDLRKQLGENARKRVEEKFDVNKNIAEYVALFSARRTVRRGAETVVDSFA